MAKSERSTVNVSSQFRLMRKVETIIFGNDGMGSEILKGDARRDLEMNAETLELARLFARASGLNVKFQAALQTDASKRTFGELFRTLAREAEQAVYAYF